MSKLRSGKENKVSKDCGSAKEEDLVKGVQNAIKVLQSLSSDLASASTTLRDSRNFVDMETQYKTRILELEEKNKQLHETCCRAEETFTNSCLALTKKLDSRSDQLEKEYLSRALKERGQAEADVSRLQAEINLERQEFESSRQRENAIRAGLEEGWAKDKEVLCRESKKFQQVSSQSQAQLQDLTRQHEALREALDDQVTIARGRERESEVLQRRLAEYEAFEPLDVKSVCSSLDDVRRRLDTFCTSCIDAAELLPGRVRHLHSLCSLERLIIQNWVPESLRTDSLPDKLDLASDEGFRIFAAMLQHSIVTTILTYIFLSAPSCACREGDAIANILYKSKPKLEAVWRYMTATAILKEPIMAGGFQRKFDKVAESLLNSWGLFKREKARREVQAKLTELFCICQDRWLKFMLAEERLVFMREGSCEYFSREMAGSPEKAVNMPGGFNTQPGDTPVLCLFPALLVNSATDKTRKTLVYKGAAIYQNSAVLIKTIKEAKMTTSPRLNHK